MAPEKCPEQSNSESGVALVELALVLPLLVIFAVAAWEFSRALQHIQLSVSASREVANFAYRNCVVSSGSGGDSACLNKWANEVRDAIAPFYPNIEVRATVYDMANVSTGVYSEVHSTAATFPHQFEVDANVVTGLRKNNAVNTANNIGARPTIVIGEAFIPFDPIFGAFAPLFHFVAKFGFGRVGFYDSTII